MDERAGVDPGRVDELWLRESERYEREHPRCLQLRERARAHMPHGVPMSWMASYFAHPPVWIDEGHGAHFTCADGHRFLDTNVGDKSTFCGIDPEPVVRAVQRRVAAGSQFMLPTEDSAGGRRGARAALAPSLLAVHPVGLAGQHGGAPAGPSRHRSAQGPQLHRQLRRARRRDARRRSPERAGSSYLGLAPAADRDIDVIRFNDAGALERALAGGDYACVFTEPALTNEGVVLPEPGFHDALRRLTRAAGTLLLLDETHTLICGPGGLAEKWELEPDAWWSARRSAAGCRSAPTA